MEKIQNSLLFEERVSLEKYEKVSTFINNQYSKKFCKIKKQL